MHITHAGKLLIFFYVLWVIVDVFSVNRVAEESHKIPPEVIMFENYHHLLNCLSTLKIASLDQEKKEVKTRYLEHLQSYVTAMLGRPLEKLSVSHVTWLGF